MLRRWFTKALEILIKRAGPSSWQRIGSLSGWPFSWLHEASSGGWQRNEEVSIETGLSNPTLYACVTLISGDISKCRPQLVERDQEGIWRETEIPAFSPVLRKPNHFQNRIEFFEWWMLSKLTHGNTYILKARDARNVVVALYILDPTRVHVLVAPDGSVFYDLETDDLAGQSDPVVVPAREIIHDKNCPLFHPLCGIPPLYAAGAPALHGLTMRSQSHNFFENGGRPSGLIQAPGDVGLETAQRYADHWNANYSGDNAGKVAVLGGGLAYQPIAATAEQSELAKMLGLSDADIARVHLVPGYKVGLEPAPNVQNVEALNLQYNGHCLQKHFEKMELCLDEGLELTKVVGRVLGVYFDRDDLFQMDTLTQVKAAREAIQGGASPNEVHRRWLGEGSVEGGDQPFLQQQMWPINLLAEREIPTPPPIGRPPIEVAEEPAPQKSLPAADLLTHARLHLEHKHRSAA